MEVESVTVNGHGEGSCEQPDTAQHQHVFTTKAFIQMGRKDVENEKPHLIDRNSNVQKDVVNGNEISEKSVNESGKPISEDDVVVVEKTSSAFHSEVLLEQGVPDEDSEETDGATVESLLVNIESVIDDTLPDGNHEPAYNKREVLEEDAPVVIEKSPVSLNMENVIDIEDPRDKDLKDAREKDGSGEQVMKDEVVVVEKTSVASLLESDVLIENPEDGGKEDDTTVDSLLVNIESVIDHSPLERNQEPASGDKAEVIEEQAPVVVEKKPFSLDIEHVMTERGEVSEDNHEKNVDIEPVTKRKELFVEDDVVVVKKTIVACTIESEILVGNPDDEGKHDDSTTLESLLSNIESVIDDGSPDRSQELEDVKKADALEEDYPVVIEKKPVSINVEEAIDEKKDEQDIEPIAETEVVVVERETQVILESEILVENEEPQKEDSTTVEDLLVNIESVIDDKPSERTQESFEDEGKPLEEVPPVVIEKKPASFYMDQMIEQDDETKEENEKEPVFETAPIVVEKTAVIVESEMLVDNEETKEDDSTPVETMLVNIESVVDHTILQAAKEPSEDMVKALEEDSPVVLEKRPASFHIEHPLDEDQDKENEDTREPVSEAEPVVVDKTPVALESEMLVDNKEIKEDDSTVETLLVNIESVVDHTLLQAAKEPSEDMVEALEEDSPVVIEKRPASFHIEHPPDEDHEKKDEDEREPVFEAELVVVKKTPVELESEMLVELESPENDNATVETLFANIESVVDDTSAQQAKAEVDTRPSEAKELIEEGAPPVVEKRKRNSLEMEQLFVAQNPEEYTEKEGHSKEECPKQVDEIVINVVEKKRVCHDTPSETEENESALPEESTSSIEIDVPQVEKTKGVKDTVQETVPPALERKVAEPHQELLQRVETDEDKPTVGVTEPECRETAIIDDLEEETLESTSYTKLIHKDDGSDDELLRQVLSRKRLSAPEILPEKEKDGSAPLAPSESGILDSKEHVPTAHVSQTREVSPMSTLARTDAPSSNVEPYKGAHDEEKLIPDVPGEVSVTENVEDAGKKAANKEDEQGLLEVEDEDQADGKKKKGKKGLASPQCKCCSLM